MTSNSAKRKFHELNVLVVGTGSIGRRHIANLLSMGVKVSAYSYHPQSGREVVRKYPVSIHESLDAALDACPDAVVISNRTDQHIPVALQSAQRNCHLFIEKPISCDLTGIRELREIVCRKNLVVEVGCMLRFRPGLCTIHRLLSECAIGGL